jgi:phosphoglycolate phosphatase-like HAD superfamily hydrolase
MVKAISLAERFVTHGRNPYNFGRTRNDDLFRPNGTDSMKRQASLHYIVFAICIAIVGAVSRAAEPLPSWNVGPAKQAILDFVADATREGGPHFIPQSERIAVFDNDGTLWSEQPIYFQFAFAIDRVRALAAEHPEWQHTEPFAFVLKGDLKALAATGEQGLLQIVAATHAGLTVDEFRTAVEQWLTTAKHPRFQRPYTELVFQPMLELLAHLRASGFKTYIVSGGGVEFMRVWTEKVYGIPPEQVVGSSGKLKYELRNGEPVLVKLPEINLVNDKAGKPVGIEQQIGRRPVAAFGNSDGDYEMLRYTTAPHPAAAYRRFGLIVHHTDAEREWAYDHPSPVGQLEKALAEAAARGWVTVDMKRDWNRIYPFETSNR